MWKEYRRIKHRLLILLFGWVPFGMLLGIGLPRIFGTFVPSYVLAFAYVIVLAYTFLQYGLYPCPNCGSRYMNRQLFHSTCGQCGIQINRNS
jgi:predicted RNA-binding Zn-ribbon protein involved in translation (DUF1610 family)